MSLIWIIHRFWPFWSFHISAIIVSSIAGTTQSQESWNYYILSKRKFYTGTGFPVGEIGPGNVFVLENSILGPFFKLDSVFFFGGRGIMGKGEGSILQHHVSTLSAVKNNPKESYLSICNQKISLLKIHTMFSIFSRCLVCVAAISLAWSITRA